MKSNPFSKSQNNPSTVNIIIKC